MFCSADPIGVVLMNKRGNPESLVPSHPGDMNAVEQGNELLKLERRPARRAISKRSGQCCVS
jgi:hypothetical protein